MTIEIINPGLQLTLQGTPYSGHRHIGMPAAGAADCLSLALANRLVGNHLGDLALEITLSGATFLCQSPTVIALTGAVCDFLINNAVHEQHAAIRVNAGDLVKAGPAHKGCRSYLAILGSFEVAPLLGGRSTYQAAKLGGHLGRALKAGDALELGSISVSESQRITPDLFIPAISNGAILRVTTGPEFDHLNDASKNQLFDSSWSADSRMNRMGIKLESSPLGVIEAASMPSAPVFPGTIQCPPDGSPFLLGPDAQTTGGYPRIAQVIRADRHLIGQLTPGSKVQLVRTTPERATKIYREKLALLKPWLGEMELW